MRILFITATRIGDAVLSTGLLAELARRHPDARFTVACGPGAAALFASNDRVERLIVMRKGPAARHWRRLWAQVVLTRWELVVDLRRSALGWLVRARRRATPPKAGDEHRVVTMARTLGFDPPPGPTVWTSADDVARACALLGAAANDGRPVLALAPTANWAGKVWPVARFVALMQRLTGPDGPLPGAAVFVTGGPDEAHQAQELLDAIPPARRVSAFGLDLPATAAVFRHCRLFVGNDSGLMHLAAAAGTPTIGLFGPTDDKAYGPWGAACRVVRTPESKRELIGRPGFDFKTAGSQMTSLEVAPVERAARELLDATSSAAAPPPASGQGALRSG